jgi:N-acetylglucosaminyldiphosphoundecaprenol N-acetyl-beta-D-mannosaminyltransferase
MSRNSLEFVRKNIQDSPKNNAYLLGRRITCITSDSLIHTIHEACSNGKKIIVANYNIHSFNMSIQFSWFYEFLQSADITHCDGIGIVYALRFMGYKIPIEHRISYTELMPKLLQHCDENNFSIYFLGAKRENLKVALENIRQQYSNIRIAGHHGYFPFDDRHSNEQVISEINHFRPNILIVGMGMPIQEYWVRQHQEKLKVNSILLGGAVIDRLAGFVPECPEILSKSGLEWLFRLVQEPKRLSIRYVLGNPAFLLQVALAKLLNLSVGENFNSDPKSLD